jgi:dipeptidyl aminopeptidase/acylaminoacyl peptidase
VRHFRGNLSNLRIKPLSNGGFGFACSAPTTPQGKMATPETEGKTQSTGKVYDKLFVRHWDAWCSKAENSVWYGRLQRDDSASAMTFASSDGLTNALAGTKLVSPVPPFGGTGDFDIGPEGLVFVSKDPELKPLASYTKSDLYFIPLSTFQEEPAPKPKVVKTPGLEGYSASPIFAHDGKRVAFTRMRSRQYESDKTRLMVVDVTSGALTAEEFYKTEDGEGRWDAKPEGILWSRDDKTIFVTAEEHGRSKVWKLPSSPAEAKELPVALTDEGNVSAIALLAEAGDSDQLFLSSSSIVDNSSYTLLDPSASTAKLISSATLSGKKFGLSHSQLSSFWTPSSDRTYNIHSWVLKPSTFSPDKKYPLCFWIHGGPQGAWMDGWSTRWNPAIFAEAGYIVVSPNPTGSSGYGMALQDGITGQWGGRPYEDLVKAFEYVQDNLHYVDTENAVAMGASYGGYMISKPSYRADRTWG